MNEIIDPEDQLALLQTILTSALNTIRQQAENQAWQQPTNRPKFASKTIPKAKSTYKPKAIPKPKKAPYAAAPKPLPKPKRISQTPAQIKHHQQKHQQDYAQAVEKTFDKDVAKMPKSLQPLPSNMISPIGGGDPELNKKLELARRQGERNRSNGSIPLS
jgi:hypothetical protein